MNTNQNVEAASAEKAYTEEQFLWALNGWYRHIDLLALIVDRIDEWHTLDKQSLIELVGESDRLTADDMPEDSWLQDAVREYQAAIEAKYSR